MSLLRAHVGQVCIVKLLQVLVLDAVGLESLGVVRQGQGHGKKKGHHDPWSYR